MNPKEEKPSPETENPIVLLVPRSDAWWSDPSTMRRFLKQVRDPNVMPNDLLLHDMPVAEFAHEYVRRRFLKRTERDEKTSPLQPTLSSAIHEPIVQEVDQPVPEEEDSSATAATKFEPSPPTTVVQTNAAKRPAKRRTKESVETKS